MFKNFIEKLQNSDESVKIRWLIGLSAVAMVIIVSFWLVYLNYSIKTAWDSENQKSEIEFWQIFKTGLKVAGISIKNNIKIFTSKISSERTVIMEP